MSAESNRFKAFECQKGTLLSTHPPAKRQRTAAAQLVPTARGAPDDTLGHASGSLEPPALCVDSRAAVAASQARAPLPAAVYRPSPPIGDDATDAAQGAQPPPRRGALSHNGRQIATVERLRPLTGCPPKGIPEKLGDQPLRLILVGHNPSAHAWQTGHVYSNPSNWLWRILKTVGIAPACIRGAEDDDLMLTEAGVGFLDVGTGHPGTRSHKFTSATFADWASVFYDRLSAHMRRASASLGCTCGCCGAPALVAFTGKRQFLELMNIGRGGQGKVTKVDFGRQAALPAGWPLPASTEVHVCTSTSGAAALTVDARVAPYQALADRMLQMPWPRMIQRQCVK